MDENALISQAIQKKLGAEYGVEARTDYHQYDIDSKADAGLTLIVRNPLIESDPEKAKLAILKGLAEIDELKLYVVAETNTNHMERLAKELEYFRAQEATLAKDTDGKSTTTIHDKTPDWFRELPKRSGWNIKHALDVVKTDTGIVNITINIPKDVSAEDIVKNIESRKEAILEKLGERTVKYTPTAKTKEEKDALAEKVKNLDFSVTSQSDGENKTLKIYIMSKEQLAATKLPGGISADKVKDLSATNPLLVLQNGQDDHEPGKPQPHLQKALSRAILFAGENHADILPFVLGKEDMRRMVGKSLTGLKEKAKDNAELTKRIDAFMADPVFKDPYQWGKEVEKQEFVPEAPHFFKMTGNYTDPNVLYEPGVMRVELKLPAEKFPEIRAKLAGTTPGAAGAGLAAADVVAAVDARIKPLVEALVTTVQNQQQIANHIVEQETKNATSSGTLENAATALVQVANKLGSWVDRMESQAGKAPPAAPAAASGDEALANSILAAAGVAVTQEATLAGAIAASGPTSLLQRAEKTPSEPGQFV